MLFHRVEQQVRSFRQVRRLFRLARPWFRQGWPSFRPPSPCRRRPSRPCHPPVVRRNCIRPRFRRRTTRRRRYARAWRFGIQAGFWLASTFFLGSSLERAVGESSGPRSTIGSTPRHICIRPGAGSSAKEGWTADETPGTGWRRPPALWSFRCGRIIGLCVSAFCEGEMQE